VSDELADPGLGRVERRGIILTVGCGGASRAGEAEAGEGQEVAVANDAATDDIRTGGLWARRSATDIQGRQRRRATCSVVAIVFTSTMVCAKPADPFPKPKGLADSMSRRSPYASPSLCTSMRWYEFRGNGKEGCTRRRWVRLNSIAPHQRQMKKRLVTRSWLTSSH
jgi:hypothetical protein